MGERARKGSSKWDLKEENHHLSPDHRRTSNRELDKASTWDDDRGYGTRMSPGLSDWRKHRCHSPRDRWDRPARKRSRSRSRTRSRSPARAFRQESASNDRYRSRSGAPCRDFAAGRCRRGDDCPFFHQGNRDYDDSREGGIRKGGGNSRYPNTYNDSREPPGRTGGDRDRRLGICKFFAAGNCRSGKFCRFSHSSRASESPNRRLDEEKPMLPHNNSDMSIKIWEDLRFDDGDGRKGGSDRNLNGRWEPRLAAVPEPNPTERVLGDLEMSPDWNYGVNSSSQVKDDETRFEPPGFSQNFSASVLHGQNIEQKHHGLHAMPMPPPNISHVDVVLATDPLREGGILKPMSPFAERKQEFDAWQPNTSQITGISPNKSSEQLTVTQLTNISASLAQLLGAGKQLPELYAALSTPGDGPPQVSSNISVVPQKLYDPLCDSIEKAVSVDHQIGVSSVPVVPVATANGEKEVHLLSSSDADRSGNGNSEPYIDMEENIRTAADGDYNSEDSEEARTEKGGREKKRKNGRTEKVDRGEKKDEENKKSKEGKALRAFKFALAENVKELMKPSWKEGLVAKDAYKTIVKKVVDKVTGSLQGPSIPQTQEKIDSYLKLSKPKLTKLVQAYVEKFQKSK